jgi:hypothetical protein
MKRKIVSCVLVASVSFYIGCYSTETVTREELEARVEKADVTVYTKDSLEYKFSKGEYRIKGDTLSGSGVRWSGGSSNIVLDASLSFADVTLVKATEFSLGNTALLCGGIGLGAGVIIFFLTRHNDTPGISLPYGPVPAGQ